MGLSIGYEFNAFAYCICTYTHTHTHTSNGNHILKCDGKKSCFKLLSIVRTYSFNVFPLICGVAILYAWIDTWSERRQNKNHNKIRILMLLSFLFYILLWLLLNFSTFRSTRYRCWVFNNSTNNMKINSKYCTF